MIDEKEYITETIDTPINTYTFTKGPDVRPTEGYVPTYPEKPKLKMSGLLKALVSKVQ